MDRPKTLSAAIRLGATFRPKCQYVLFDNGGSCAIGAAAEALGSGPDSELKPLVAIYKAFPELRNRSAQHPRLLRRQISSNVCSIVMDLNDCHHWSREEIADWLESIGL